MPHGEEWRVEFDLAVGSKIRKTRPTAIVSDDAINRNQSCMVMAPMTNNTGKQYPDEAVVTISGQSSKSMPKSFPPTNHGEKVSLARYPRQIY